MKFNLLRFTNSVILVAIIVLSLTGVYGLFWGMPGWTFDLHRVSGWLLIATIPWKTAISLRSLRRGIRPDFDRGLVTVVSILLGAATLVIIALGLAWGWRLLPERLWLRQTAISWHWILALGLLVPFAVHVWRRWPRPQKSDFLSRRGALKVLGLTAAALAGWRAADWLGEIRASPVSPNRFSGSRLEGYHSGNDYPVTHTVAARQDQVDPATWRLVVEGAGRERRTFSYLDLISLPSSEFTATLDCTLGWYATQQWRGIPLKTLLDSAGVSPNTFVVRLESVTGYAHILPLEEAEQVLLATHVGGEVLEHAHGFPVRAVVPTRRGWFWVKWLSRIEAIGLGNIA